MPQAGQRPRCPSAPSTCTMPRARRCCKYDQSHQCTNCRAAASLAPLLTDGNTFVASWNLAK
eukprot:7013964-Lingulodinium_polyedra.AAC.1